MAIANAVAEAGLVRPCCSCCGLFTPTVENAGDKGWAGAGALLESWVDGAAGVWLVLPVFAGLDGGAAGSVLAGDAGITPDIVGSCQPGRVGWGKDRRPGKVGNW
jgi:hypothetical protein